MEDYFNEWKSNYSNSSLYKSLEIFFDKLEQILMFDIGQFDIIHIILELFQFALGFFRCFSRNLISCDFL